MKEIYFKNRKSFHWHMEMKLFISAILRGEECTIAKHYRARAITRYILASLHNALGLWRKVLAWKSYALGIT